MPLYRYFQPACHEEERVIVAIEHPLVGVSKMLVCHERRDRGSGVPCAGGGGEVGLRPLRLIRCRCQPVDANAQVNSASAQPDAVMAIGTNAQRTEE